MLRTWTVYLSLTLVRQLRLFSFASLHLLSHQQQLLYTPLYIFFQNFCYTLFYD